MIERLAYSHECQMIKKLKIYEVGSIFLIGHFTSGLLNLTEEAAHA